MGAYHAIAVSQKSYAFGLIKIHKQCSFSVACMWVFSEVLCKQELCTVFGQNLTLRDFEG